MSVQSPSRATIFPYLLPFIEDFIDDIWELERAKRKKATDRLLPKISENNELLPKFILALSDQGYQRFADPINNIYPDRGRKFCQEFFEFLIHYMKGELVDILEPLQTCAYLYRNRCIELSDKEAIEAMQYSRGRTAACQEMFQTVKRRKDNWALLLLEAIKETQEYVKLKMDPSASQEELERTGILAQTSVMTVDRQLLRKSYIGKVAIQSEAFPTPSHFFEAVSE
ncbi:uncharacterized protein LOC134692598 [Mytilus trossulus]|uniref:uncharacterized protein LOC134692598 n=1 Tax=Mytilus trossulus TaxID=6551 RepID=UPI003007A38C